MEAEKHKQTYIEEQKQTNIKAQSHTLRLIGSAQRLAQTYTDTCVQTVADMHREITYKQADIRRQTDTELETHGQRDRGFPTDEVNGVDP